jgi:hypothetical protein
MARRSLCRYSRFKARKEERRAKEWAWKVSERKTTRKAVQWAKIYKMGGGGSSVWFGSGGLRGRGKERIRRSIEEGPGPEGTVERFRPCSFALRHPSSKIAHGGFKLFESHRRWSARHL